MEDSLLVSCAKVLRVIKSCKNQTHLDGAIRMLENFKISFPNNYIEYEKLLNHLHSKLNSHGDKEE